MSRHFSSGLAYGGVGDVDSYTKLLLHYEGPDTTTTVIDASPARNGTAGHGDETKVAVLSTGKFGSGLRVANTYSVFQYSEDFEFDAGDFTIDWWENRSEISDSKPSIVRDGAGPYQAFLLGWSYASGSQRAYFSTDGTTWTGQLEMGTFTVGTWYHLAIVRKGVNFYAFRNGVLQQSGPMSGALMRSYNSLCLGYYYSGQAYVFNGFFDEVRITKGKAIWTANFTPPTGPYGPSEDTDTRLLLHFNDSNGSKAIIDASPRLREAANVFGNVAISTAQSKFGGSSLSFPGIDGHYISFPDSIDWTFNQPTCTLDCWIRFGALPAMGSAAAIASQDEGATGLWILMIGGDGNVYMLQRQGANDYTVAGPAFLTQVNTWHHIALVRFGSGPANAYGMFKLYINGVGGAVANIPGPTNFVSPLYIGTWKGAAYAWNGQIDEFRVSRTARWTADFAPPTAPHLPVDKGSPATVLLTAESAYDKSSHRHGAWIVAGGVQVVANGPSGGRFCWLFDGSTASNVQFPFHQDWNFGNRDWTVEWWEYRASATGCIVARDNVNGYVPFLFGYGHGGNERSCFITASGSAWDILSNTDGGTFGVQPLNTWTHYAIERIRDNTIWLFVNGVIINGKNITPGVSIWNGGNHPISIANYASNAYPLYGYIDDLRISNFGRYESTGFTPTGPYPA